MDEIFLAYNAPRIMDTRIIALTLKKVNSEGKILIV